MKSEASEERRAKWQSLVEEQETSGLTQLAFCKSHNLVLSQFVYYRGLIKGKEYKRAVSTKPFAPVQVSRNGSNSVSEIRIILPNGFQCYVSSHVEVVQIKRLVETLLSC
jgi:hypothetical protein